jgi:hypothetical protein
MQMAPFLSDMVARLRAFGELDLDDATAARLRHIGGHDRPPAGWET